MSNIFDSSQLSQTSQSTDGSARPVNGEENLSEEHELLLSPQKSAIGENHASISHDSQQANFDDLRSLSAVESGTVCNQNTRSGSSPKVGRVFEKVEQSKIYDVSDSSSHEEHQCNKCDPFYDNPAMTERAEELSDKNLRQVMAHAESSQHSAVSDMQEIQNKSDRRLNGIDVVQRVVKNQITKRSQTIPRHHTHALSTFSASVEQRFCKLASIMDDYRNLLMKSKRVKSNKYSLNARLERIRQKRRDIQKKISEVQKMSNSSNSSIDDKLALQVGSLCDSLKTPCPDG